MDIRLDGKVAIVTGAASGIGQAIAEGLCESGAQVVIADINLEAAERTASAFGDRAVAMQVDVADVAACKRLVDDTIAQFGQLDILVNNAGICPLRPTDEVDQEFFDLLFAVNVRGAYFLSQAAAQHMKARQTGRIINISSVGGRTGGTLAVSVYAATKAALFSVTKSFATYLAPYGTVNTIAPGPSYTPLTDAWDADHALKALEQTIPLKRLGQPADYKGIAVFLASDYASYMTGATVDINGGFRMD
ncbi:MAG: SDR family oxidoreductase [Chloroflexi bacterium]|nr:MAG: SDR family oxidoreductase [Chloroflexota bacterium]